MPKKLTLAASGATLALLLSACGSSSGGSGSAGSGSSDLADVEYNMNGATAEPSVSFATPFAASGTSAHVIEEGTGEEIKDGDEVLINATIFSGEDGSSQGTTYTSAPMLIPIGDSLKNNAPELYEVLSKNKVGTSFSYTTNKIASTDATASPSTAAEGTATSVEVYTIAGKVLKEASGKTTPENEVNSALKSFTISEDDGTATITLADDRGDAPTELVSQNLITGDGAVVGKTDTVYVRYQGVTWSDGKSFDGNYGNDNYTIDLSLSSVIQGWTEGLAGKTVGSRVLLIIPKDLAYGDDAAANGSPEGALVFVVDILGSAPGPVATETATASASAVNTEAAASASPVAEESAAASAEATAEATAEASE